MTSPRLFDYLIGFDSFAQELARASSNDSFPPFNIYRDGEKTILEFALAGYTRENISVVVEDNILKIAAKKEKVNEEKTYTHKGIALRSFHKQFALNEYAVVQKAEFINGVLRVEIAVVLPESKKPRTIPIY